MDDAVLDDAQVAAMRTKALSLLKSKMKKRSRSARGTHQSHQQLKEHQQMDSEQLVESQPETAAAHQDEGEDAGVSRLSEDDEVEHGVPSSQETSATTPGLSEPAQQLQQQQQQVTTKLFTKRVVKWSCGVCKRECIPIREESRCLCGHRYKEHPTATSDPRVKNKASFKAFACTSAKCACKKFFYVVAEGAWILRCRCKHKHIEHDPSGDPFKCSKPKCSCSGFDSPWICNCNHAWAEHSQETVEKQLKPLLERFQEQFEAQELCAVQRADLLAEPLLQF
ncbi:hypothetical protein Gpo141_00001836 [Globisporangium polare]